MTGRTAKTFERGEAERELRTARRWLRALASTVAFSIRRLDEEMQNPATLERGKRIATICNDLQLSHDMATRFGLPSRRIARGRSDTTQDSAAALRRPTKANPRGGVLHRRPTVRGLPTRGAEPHPQEEREVKRIEVDNCAGCPFYRFPTNLCTAQGRRTVDIAPVSLPPPDWCPLRRADHLVILRVK